MGNLTVLNGLPFALPDGFGKAIRSRTECPGVYYATIRKSNVTVEYYFVTEEATMISLAARAYGEQICTSPVLPAYCLDDFSKGKYIIDYEIFRYKIQNKLPLPEGETIHNAVVFGRELHPDYFGAFPVPQLTPWGDTLRYKVLTKDVCYLSKECQNFAKVRQTICFSSIWFQLTAPTNL